MESTSPPATKIIPVPVPAIQHEGTYTYVAVKGSLYASDSAVFGLSKEEETALANRFATDSDKIVGGVMIKNHPIKVINTLSQLGYKVVSSTGEAEVVWTMQREV
ncbi:uncharacterized protein LOC132261643 [Phlebotomus argentipes]|uniref:uncharacterized protein LOC132261643 n=1 Tax=Phlebotomus argentipes TaxID=94469 RepID=UPI002893148E|nr:uncharacterized protein LOC132261643 [Phlebotomus argentipes]